MIHHIEAGQKVDISAQAAWKAIDQLTAIDIWYPNLATKDEKLEASPSGFRRRYLLENGSAFVERILLRDVPTRIFIYSVETVPMPAKNIVGMMRVDEISEHECNVISAVDMLLDPIHAEGVSEVVQAIFDESLAALTVSLTS